MKAARRKEAILVVGAGRAGLGLARCLRARGVRITAIVSRGRRSAARASRVVGKGLGTTRLSRGLPGATIVLVCVPDRAVRAVARELSRHPLQGKVVLHTSGSLDLRPLDAASRSGAATGSLHPLTTFPMPPAPPPDLRGVAFAVDGDPKAVRLARRLARAVGGDPVTVPAGRRAAYHLAASLSANALVALLDAAFEVARRELGWSDRRVRQAFVPLARAAIDNVGRSGSRRALTGPVARGDRPTIEKHLKVLAHGSRRTRDLYLLLARRALEMASEQGLLSREDATRLRRVLTSAAD